MPGIGVVVTSSTSATHVLSWTAPNEQSLFITINGVKQQDDAYSIAGSPTTITLTDALVATDKMEVIGVLDIGVITIVGDNTVSTAKLGANAVTTAKLGDSSVTLAKLSTTGTAVAGNYLDGTMAWTAVEGGAITTEGDYFYNYNTISSNLTTTVETTKAAFVAGPITIADTFTWTIVGELTMI
ncbi:hypothetical protein [Mesonia mobilis]|uniref:hypothetical protein n=1 Tax=Mesonia mobilis TaxID=369791 RepID=UPI0026F1ECC6|nr:hypothetical protein [Mesonia mobilis]